MHANANLLTPITYFCFAIQAQLITMKVDFWNDFDRRASAVVANPRSSAICLLRQYVDEPIIVRQQDPLLRWRERLHVYKHLVPVTQLHLCI